MTEQVGEKGLVGLPPNLLQKDKRGWPRVFSLMPGFNRGQRRGLATRARSVRLGRTQTAQLNDTDAILHLYQQPTFRRVVFWRELDNGPPSADVYSPSLFITVDFWLLREFEPHLDLLAPPTDAEMVECCPHWTALCESLRESVKVTKGKFDARYFALWPRLLEMVPEWEGLSEDMRVSAVNAAFALSSISGDPWFVEEFQRRCMAAEPYFAGLKRKDHPTSHAEDSHEIDQEATTEEVTPDAVDLPAASGGPLDWQALGAELRRIGVELEAGVRDPAIAEALDLLWDRYQVLKQESPLRASAREALQTAFLTLESFVREIGEGTAAGMIDAAALVARWRAATDVASANEECERLQRDVERATVEGRAAAEQLDSARAALLAAAAQHTDLQETERSATDWGERRAARRSLGELEGRLPELRREEESAEEALLAVIEPRQFARSPVGPITAASDPLSCPRTSKVTGQEESPASEVPVENGMHGMGEPAIADRMTEPLVQAEAALPAAEERAVGMVESPAAVETPPTQSAQMAQESAEVSAQTNAAEELGEESHSTEADATPGQCAASPEPSAPEAAEDEFTDQAGEACRPIWRALGRGRPGAAFFIASALHEALPDLRVPSPDLIRAVALSQHLKSPDGEITRELTQVFTEIDPAVLGTGPDSWKVANNLLLAAACLRPLLLAPETSAAAMAGYVHLGEEYVSLYRLRTLLTEYGSRLRASRLDAGAFRSAASAGDWQAAMTRLAAEANEWRQKAPSMNTLYPAATAVWRHWLKSGAGMIWRMLDPVITGNVEQVEQTRRLVEQLADKDRREGEITHTDRKELKRQKGQDISFGALEQLHGKTDAAVQLAQRWLALASARPGQGDFIAREIASLQRAVVPLIEQVLGELQSATEDDDWRLVPSARRCVREIVHSIGAMFALGGSGDESEWPAAKAVGMDLLLAYPVALGDRWNWESSPAQLLEIVRADGSDERPWAELVRARIECGDICNALRIIEQAGAAPEADELRRDANRTAVQLRSSLKQRLNKSRETVELAFAYRIVGEEERADASEIIADLERLSPDETRFDRANLLLDTLEQNIAAKKERRLEELSEVAERIRLTRPDVSFAKVDECIAVGDLASAHEWLQRIESGYSEEEESAERDMFAEFFPARLRTIETAMAALKTAEPLLKAVTNGESFGEVEFGALPADVRRAAADLVKSWYLFKQDRGHPIEAIERVLRGLGFAQLSNVQVVGQPSGRREFRFDAEPIADRAVCPLPLFGSRAAGKYRLVCLPSSATEEEILSSAGAHAAGRPTIAFVLGRLGEMRRRTLAKLARDRRESVLVLDENLMVFIAGERRSRLAAFFHCALPFAHTDPFVQTSGDVPPEMFFGRIDELRAVMGQHGRCLVYGGRQLGKTALLRHAERNFHQPSRRHYAKWIDLRAEGIGYGAEPGEVWSVIWRKLQETGAGPGQAHEPKSAIRGRVQAFIDSLRVWLDEDMERRLLLLLDEADRFLALDARNHYQETVRLKNLMETTGRRFKVVFAGLHNVLRAAEQANHPLAHLGEPIEIGPLIKHAEWKEAGELLRRPLFFTGFELESRRLVDRVLAQTNYYPSLIQVYGSKLLGHRVRAGLTASDMKNGPRYVIRSHHLDETYQQGDLREEIKTRFHLTLQLDQRYEVVAYSVAYAVVLGQGRMEEGIPVSELRTMAYSWWEAGFRQTNEREFDTMLDEMVGLGVLRKVSEGHFALRNPNILLLMGSADEILSMLGRDREVPEEFDPGTWRVSARAGGDALRRSPLTLLQVADLVRPVNGVTILAGCAAANIGDAERYLAEQIESEYLITVEDTADRVRFRRILDTIDDREGGGTTVYLVPQTVAWSTEWVDDATLKLNRLRAKDKHARVVFVADPRTLLTELRAGLNRERVGVEWMNVRPWHESFVRHWLTDQHALNDAESLRQIAADTGYWPMLLEQWMKLARAHGRGNGKAPPGSLFKDEELVAALGLDLPELASPLATMAVVASDAVNLDELLGLEPRERADVEMALQMASRLSLVSPASGGRWRLDPVVAVVLANR